VVVNQKESFFAKTAERDTETELLELNHDVDNCDAND
jgi:hypothetical protein